MDKSNLVKRIISSLVLVPIVLYCMYRGGYVFGGFLLMASYFMIIELRDMLQLKKMHVLQGLLFAVAPFIFYTFLKLEFETFLLLLLSFVFCNFIIELFRKSDSAVLNLAGTSFTFFYAIIPLACLLGIREYYSLWFESPAEHGAYIIYLIFVCIWACDTFAYFGGTLLGKHRLMERVSPKKSIEGALFGFVGSLGISAAIQIYFLDSISLEQALMLGAIIGVFGQIGDLVESLLKRDVGVKDSGTTIPGHGGILDRLDSVNFVAPIIFLVLHVWK